MKDGRRTGPYQPFRLREMMEDGTLLPGDPVWHEGMENWQPLEKTESLRAVFHREPAAPPAAPEQEGAPQAPTPPGLPDNPAAVLILLRVRRILATRRFFARQIDMLLASVATVGTAAACGWADVWQLHLPDSIPMLLAPALVWLLVEPILLCTVGTTPGKAALGLRVEAAGGGRLSLRQAAQRSLLVWAGGMGFGLRAVYILPVVQWAYAWWMLQRRGTTLWDHTSGTTVRAEPLQRRHGVGMALAAAVYITVHLWLSLVPPLPARMNDKDRVMFEELRRQAQSGN